MKRSRGKRIMLDYTQIMEIDGDEEIVCCLTRRQSAVLKALLTTAYWSKRWLNLIISDDSLQAMVAEIDSRLDGNDCVMPTLDFRDNPADVCEVQYSSDGGENWTTMFRKDVCPTTPGTTSVDITNMYTNITTVTTNNTTWNYDITNVAPDWAYVDSDSDKALCYVIDRYIDWLCDFFYDQIESGNEDRRNENDWLDDVAVLLSELVMDVVIKTAGAITLPVLVMGAIAYASVQIVEYVWDELVGVDSSQFKDEDARDTVKCAMWNQIRGETPQFTTWATSLDNFNYGEATIPEQSIASSVTLWNKETDVYINWLILFEDINSISSGLPICACPQTDTFDQLAGPTELEMYGTEYTQNTALAFSSGGDPAAVCPGDYFEVLDRYAEVPSSIGGVGCNIRVTLPADRLVTQLTIRYGASRPSTFGGGDKNYGAWIGTPYGGGVEVCSGSWPTGTWPDQKITKYASDEEGLTATPESYIYIHNSMQTGSGTAYIIWVHVETIPYVP